MVANNEQWIEDLKARGWAGAFSTALDVLEPFGALGAQIAYVAQPAFGLIGLGNMIGGLARALETPEGIAALQAKLRDSEATSSDPNDGSAT